MKWKICLLPQANGAWAPTPLWKLVGPKKPWTNFAVGLQPGALINVTLDLAVGVWCCCLGSAVNIHPQSTEVLSVGMLAVIGVSVLGAAEVGVELVIDEPIYLFVELFAGVVELLADVSTVPPRAVSAL